MDDRFFRDAASGKGKRERTLAALLDAAVDVTGSKGMEAAKISDMTTAAGLANGTFYNYFQSKEEILQKIAMEVAIEVSRRLDAQMAGIDDGPTRIVTATAGFVDLTLTTPDWAAILFDAGTYLPEPRKDSFQYLRADIAIGIEQGAFKVEVDTFTVSQVVALISAAIRTQLAHGRNADLTRRLCINILRLLGLPVHKADKVVRQVLG